MNNWTLINSDSTGCTEQMPYGTGFLVRTTRYDQVAMVYVADLPDRATDKPVSKKPAKKRGK